MLTTVEAYSAWKSAPLLPLSAHGPETDLLQVRNIEGLGPVKANVNTSLLGSLDGEAYTGASIPKRNILITLGLNPDWDNWSMEQLRRLVYSYFVSKLRTRLVFRSDTFPPVEISGVVESCEPVLFTKDQEIVVSIICPDPYFTAVEATVVTGFTARDNSAPLEIDYGGSVEAGINLQVVEQALPAPTLIGIQIGDPTETFFRAAASVSATKYFVVNSVPGQKYVRNVELGSGVITNLLSKVQTGSEWPTLKPGVNDFTVITDLGAQDWTLSYFERFGGL